MPRPVLEEARIHPAIRERIATRHADIVHNVQAAAASNQILVVGLAWNGYCRKARRLLHEAGLAHQYLEFGSYLSQWRRRNALKMWTGWPTFPMVFAKGVLIGGYDDLKRLVDSGELKRFLVE
jgi:glutaredoxin-related protein